MARRRWLARLARTLVLLGLLVAAASDNASRRLPLAAGPVTSFMLLDRGSDYPRQHAGSTNGFPAGGAGSDRGRGSALPHHAGFDFEAIDRGTRGRRAQPAATLPGASTIFSGWPEPVPVAGPGWPRTKASRLVHGTARTVVAEAADPPESTSTSPSSVRESGASKPRAVTISAGPPRGSAASRQRCFAAVLPDRSASDRCPSARIRERGAGSSDRWALGGPACLDQLQPQPLGLQIRCQPAPRRLEQQLLAPRVVASAGRPRSCPPQSSVPPGAPGTSR